MKLAISSSGSALDAAVDQRFGRAESFIIYDTDTGAFKVIDNEQNLNAAQGAGIQSAQHVVNAGAEALITGHTGPKAFKVLQAGKIAIYLTGPATVSGAIEAWKAGTLEQITSADVEGHWI